jgi:hypothetical protein
VEVAQLLRDEHRWVAEMVEGEKILKPVSIDNVYNAACNDILAKLKARAK